jgi:hypothetical protein
MSKHFGKYLSDKNIEIEDSSVDCQFQNPVERHIQNLDNVVAASFHASRLEKQFQGLCLLSSVTVLNYTPNELSGEYSPWYCLTGRHPDLSNTCKYPFGQSCIIAKTKRERVIGEKFEVKNFKGYAMGSVLSRNGSTLVYIPGRKGHQYVFERKFVKPISLAPKDYIEANNDVTDECNDEDKILISKMYNNIQNEYDGGTVANENIESNHIIDSNIQQEISDTENLDKSQQIYNDLIGLDFVINNNDNNNINNNNNVNNNVQLNNQIVNENENFNIVETEFGRRHVINRRKKSYYDYIINAIKKHK